MSASPESPIWLEINGRRRTVWSCTPDHVMDLIVGRLLSEGYITNAAEVIQVAPCNEPDGCLGFRVSVPESHVASVARERRHVRELGCGALHFVTCDPATIRRARNAVIPDAGELRDAFRALFAATDDAYPYGGMHAAAIWSGNALQPPCFDVGRHNAVDRALGRALQGGVTLAAAGLLLSARISGAIALKAARAGIGFIASRSIPTTLAEQIAAAAELPIVARAGRRSERSEP